MRASVSRRRVLRMGATLGRTPAVGANPESEKSQDPAGRSPASRRSTMIRCSDGWPELVSRHGALQRSQRSDVLERLLAGLGAQRLVIGHLHVGRGGRLAGRFDGTVFKLDTGMNRAVYHGHPAVLVLERAAAGDRLRGTTHATAHSRRARLPELAGDPGEGCRDDAGERHRHARTRAHRRRHRVPGGTRGPQDHGGIRGNWQTGTTARARGVEGRRDAQARICRPPWKREIDGQRGYLQAVPRNR